MISTVKSNSYIEPTNFEKSTSTRKITGNTTQKESVSSNPLETELIQTMQTLSIYADLAQTEQQHNHPQIVKEHMTRNAITAINLYSDNHNQGRNESTRKLFGFSIFA